MILTTVDEIQLIGALFAAKWQRRLTKYLNKDMYQEFRGAGGKRQVFRRRAHVKVEGEAC